MDQFPSFASISSHQILSSAKYILAVKHETALSGDANSSVAPFKNLFNGSPFIHSHLKVENAPGKTLIYPNRLSDDFSK